MDSVLHEKSSFNPKRLLIDHNIIDFKCRSYKHLLNRHEIDETEKKLLDFISNKKKFKIKSDYEHEKEDFDFLSSKLETMEKMSLDDECLVEGEIETKKINKNKNKPPNSKHEIRGRIRIHSCQKTMRADQADELQYYLITKDFVTSVKIYDRTNDIVICYDTDRQEILDTLKSFYYLLLSF